MVVTGRGLWRKAVSGLVLVIQLLPDDRHLAAFEVCDPDGPPALGGTDHGAEHEFEERLFAEGVGDDLEAPSFLDEQAFQQVRGPDRPAVGDRHPQVRDAGLEVIQEAGCGTGQLGLEVSDHAIGEVAGDGARRRLVAGRGTGLEPRPEVFRHLGRQVAHAERGAGLLCRST